MDFTKDISLMNHKERELYYNEVCKSLNLNPLTRPFEYLEMVNRKQTKIILYAKKDATDQLRKTNSISIEITNRETIENIYLVSAKATMSDGRCDEADGVVSLERQTKEWDRENNRWKFGEWKRLRGEDLANEYMKAQTKAIRRVTLQICGLGFTDESEIESIPNSKILEEKIEPKQEPIKKEPIQKKIEPKQENILQIVTKSLNEFKDNKKTKKAKDKNGKEYNKTIILDVAYIDDTVNKIKEKYKNDSSLLDALELLEKEKQKLEVKND